MEFWNIVFQIIGTIIGAVIGFWSAIFIQKRKEKKEDTNEIENINIRIVKIEEILHKINNLECNEHKTKLLLIENKIKQMEEYYIVNQSKIFNQLELLSNKFDKYNEQINDKITDVKVELAKQQSNIQNIKEKIINNK